MVYDETLAIRIDKTLTGVPNVEQKKCLAEQHLW